MRGLQTREEANRQWRRNAAIIAGFAATLLVMVCIAIVHPHFDGTALLIAGGTGIVVGGVGTIIA